MAPVEFEKHIKEQLEERKIKPSSKAWEQIEKRIEVKQPVKKPFYFRYAAAALITGILLTSVFVLRDKAQPDIDQQPVVISPVNELENSVTNQELPSDQLTDADPATEDQNSPEKTPLVLVEEPEPAVEVQTKEIQETPAAIASAIPDMSPDPLIDEKVIEVYNQVRILEDNKVVVTDAEVDSLLRNAQQELIADGQFRDQYEVDASDLLAGVEDELNKSFRDQVFEKLKQGFVKVRTAVADRNK